MCMNLFLELCISIGIETDHIVYENLIQLKSEGHNLKSFSRLYIESIHICLCRRELEFTYIIQTL